MKKLFLSCLLLASASLFAQKIDDVAISFDYVRLPKKPIGNSINNYTSKVELTYKDRIQQMKSDYERRVAQAEQDYQQQMAQWEQAKAEIDEEFRLATEAYESKSAGAKILEKTVLNEGRPVRRSYPSMPYKNLPAEEYYPKIYSEDVLASSYIKLEGFNRNASNAVQVTVRLNGTEFGAAEIKSVERAKTVRNRDGSSQTIKETFWWYELPYKHAMSAKVSAPSGSSLFDEYIQALNEYSTYKTSEFKSKYEAENFWRSNETTQKFKLDEEITYNNLKYINDFLNDLFGYSKVNRNTVLYNVSDKKVPYDDFNSAYETAFLAYPKMAGNEKEAMEGIKKSLSIWETALKESAPEDKKARVDEKVTCVLLLNMAEAYAWVNDFAQAKMMMNKLKLLDVRKYSKEIPDLEAFILDREERFKANQ